LPKVETFENKIHVCFCSTATGCVVASHTDTYHAATLSCCPLFYDSLYTHDAQNKYSICMFDCHNGLIQCTVNLYQLLTMSSVQLPLNSLYVCVLLYNLYSLTNLCSNVELRSCGKLQGAISYFLATGSSQMNAEAASDVDPKYWLNPCSIFALQVRVGDVCRHCVGVYSSICVVVR